MKLQLAVAGILLFIGVLVLFDGEYEAASVCVGVAGMLCYYAWKEQDTVVKQDTSEMEEQMYRYRKRRREADDPMDVYDQALRNVLTREKRERRKAPRCTD